MKRRSILKGLFAFVSAPVSLLVDSANSKAEDLRDDPSWYEYFYGDMTGGNKIVPPETLFEESVRMLKEAYDEELLKRLLEDEQNESND